MKVFQNIKTFFLYFKYLRKYFLEELNKLTSERLMGDFLNKYKKHLIEDTPTNTNLYKEYQQMCDHYFESSQKKYIVDGENVNKKLFNIKKQC